MQLPEGCKEIDVTHLFPVPTVTENDFVFTDAPTMDMINEAEAANRIVVSFFDINSFGCLADYLKRFDLEPSNYCILFPKFSGYTFEELKNYWLERYLSEFNHQTSLWYAPSGKTKGEIKCVSLSPVVEQ
jgi:hypothetical protein